MHHSSLEMPCVFNVVYGSLSGCARGCACHSPDGCSPGGAAARVSTFYRRRCTLGFSDVPPLGPPQVATRGRGRAAGSSREQQERCRLGERSADQRGSSFRRAEWDVVRRDWAAYLTPAPSPSSSSSPSARPPAREVGHPLTFSFSQISLPFTFLQILHLFWCNNTKRANQ